MGRNKNIRIDGDRLKTAMIFKGWSPIEFGKMLYGDHNPKTVSTNIYRLCLPDGDKNKLGLDPYMLAKACKILDVREPWLLGQDDAMTDFEIIQEQKERVQNAQNEINNSLVRPLLKQAGYAFIKFGFYAQDIGEPEPAYIFENRKHETFVINGDDLAKMESVCADLCASMFQNYAAPASFPSLHNKKVPEKSDT